MPGLRRTLILTAVAVGALPTAAQAATLNVTSAGVYTYNAGSNVANNLQASAFGSLSLTEQASDPISVTGDAAGTCQNPGTTGVFCTQIPTSITVNLGSEIIADKVQFSAESALATVNGGPGDDDMNGLGILNGDLGNDLLSANNQSGATLNGGDGNDSLRSADGNEALNGGPGLDTADYSVASNVRVSIDGVANDGPVGQTDNVGLTVENIIGSPTNDVLTGTSNGSNVTNVITGGLGNDVIDGNDGNDFFVASREFDGSDEMIGGAGIDSANYGNRKENLRIRLDGTANDGEAGEGDNVGTDVEGLTGGFGDDFLGGQVGVVANTFSGGLGNDDLHGGSGDDNLFGNPGNDVIDGAVGIDNILGEEGNDDIDGGANNDTIGGGDGFDRIDGGTGTDTINGAAGADTLLVRDGVADTANCGTGVDTVQADPAGDTVNADCENLGDGGAVGMAEAPAASALLALPVSAPVPAPDSGRAAGGASVTVSCRIAGRRRAARRVTCKVKLPKAQSGLRARLSRKGTVYAVGRAKAAARRQTLSLRSVRKAKPGRYTLALRDAAGRRVMSVTVFVK